MSTLRWISAPLGAGVLLLTANVGHAMASPPVDLSATTHSSCRSTSPHRGCAKDKRVLEIPGLGTIEGRCVSDVTTGRSTASLWLDPVSGVGPAGIFKASPIEERDRNSSSWGTGVVRTADGRSLSIRGEARVKGTAWSYASREAVCRFQVSVTGER